MVRKPSAVPAGRLGPTSGVADWATSACLYDMEYPVPATVAPAPGMEASGTFSGGWTVSVYLEAATPVVRAFPGVPPPPKAPPGVGPAVQPCLDESLLPELGAPKRVLPLAVFGQGSLSLIHI